jgi:carbon-monoxide dehydrogenase large subunit
MRIGAVDGAAVHDIAPDNHCYKWAIGDKAAVDAAFANAAHVTKLDLVNNRLIPNAMEPRAAIAATTAPRRLHAVRQPTRTRTSSAC